MGVNQTCDFYGEGGKGGATGGPPGGEKCNPPGKVGIDNNLNKPGKKKKEKLDGGETEKGIFNDPTLAKCPGRRSQ